MHTPWGCLVEIEIHQITNGPLKQHCYIVEHLCDDKIASALIIDPGSEPGLIIDHLTEHQLQPIAILNTHGHYDHIGAVKALQVHYDLPFFIHRKEEKLLRRANLYASFFESKEKIEIPDSISYFDEDLLDLQLSEFNIRIITTPGHTPGSVCFLLNDDCFSGDTLFKGNIGRTDLPGGNKIDLSNSVDELLALDESVTLYPGHGSVTTIGAERDFHKLNKGSLKNAG